jgi:hypothetical protein
MATKIVEGDGEAKSMDAIMGTLVTAIQALRETERSEQSPEPSAAKRPTLRLVHGGRCIHDHVASPRLSADVLYSLAREGRDHPAWQSLVEPWLEPKAATSRAGDNIRRCLMRKTIRERLGRTGSIAKLILIPGGKRG